MGLVNREGEILKRTFIPFVLYGLVVGIMSYILVGMGYAKF